MAKISITYYGMDGEGPTIKEAKADAGRKIEKLVAAASEAPIIISIRGFASLVAYSGHSSGGSWASRLIMSDGKIHTGPAYLGSDSEDKHRVMVQALTHVATSAWTFDDDDQEFAEMAADRANGCPLNHSDRREVIAAILNNARFQRKYRECRDNGMDDRHAHASACGYQLPA